jgi:protein-L-isoaspartate(D-aspartate) O-methyltransferase
MSWEHILPEDDYRLFRENVSLFEAQVVTNAREAASPSILAAVRSVPRHFFVARDYRALAYTDNALPTARGLTTSAPSVIARMIHAAGVMWGARVLEVGTGTGYEAALLTEMGAEVRTIEIDGMLAGAANEILVRLGYKPPVRLYHGNGMRGCPEGAPYDAIILAAALPSPSHLPSLVSQLRLGGRLVAPVGGQHAQELVLLERLREGVRGGPVQGISVDFVRMVLPWDERLLVSG